VSFAFGGVNANTMRKAKLPLLLAGITLGALAITWCWALDPLFRLSGINTPVEWTEADYVRHTWHLRLLQPEWVSNPAEWLKWAKAETTARLLVVFLCWLGSVTSVVRRHLSRRGTPPNEALQATAAAPGS